MYNPKVVAHSVQDAGMANHIAWDVAVYRETAFPVSKRRILNGMGDNLWIVHEIDHTNGIMFYDRINPNNPFEIKEGLLILE